MLRGVKRQAGESPPVFFQGSFRFICKTKILESRDHNKV
jgi:hypothetical protein